MARRSCALRARPATSAVAFLAVVLSTSVGLVDRAIAKTSNALADEVANDAVTGGALDWSTTVLDVTEGFGMFTDMRGTMFAPTNDAWRAALAGYAARNAAANATNDAVYEALSTVVATGASEEAIKAMSFPAWYALEKLAHFHLVIERINSKTATSTYSKGVTPLYTHIGQPLYLEYVPAKAAFSLSGSSPEQRAAPAPPPPATPRSAVPPPAAAAIPSAATTFASAGRSPVPAPAAVDVNGSAMAIGYIVMPDVVDGDGYAVHGIDAVLFPFKASLLTAIPAGEIPPSPLPKPPTFAPPTPYTSTPGGVPTPYPPAPPAPAFGAGSTPSPVTSPSPSSTVSPPPNNAGGVGRAACHSLAVISVVCGSLFMLL